MNKLLILILILTPCILTAQSKKQIINYDNRIKTEIYEEKKIYNIYYAIGIATLIQLDKDEHLTNDYQSVLGIGNANAWNLGVRGNNIILKPTQKLAQTNLIVVTNKRTYIFELKQAYNNKNATYLLKFNYLDDKLSELKQEVEFKNQIAKIKSLKPKINTDYYWRGENELLKPNSAFDDGRFTKFIYNNSGDLPVFFKEMTDGNEALINYEVDEFDNRVIILNEVINKVKARLGDSVIEIINNSYKLPEFNENGTGNFESIRIIK